MTCTFAAVVTGVIAGVLGAVGMLLWLAATEDADADMHTSPTEWPSRSRRPWDAP